MITDTRMKLDVKRQWLDALRSGEYPQGNGRLCNVIPKHDANDVKVVEVRAFCCLGVLCDIAVKAGVLTESRRSAMHTREYVEYAGETSYLPSVVRDWAGLTSNDPVIDGYGLSFWNDNRKFSFDEIAALIEEKL